MNDTVEGDGMNMIVNMMKDGQVKKLNHSKRMGHTYLYSRFLIVSNVSTNRPWLLKAKIDLSNPPDRLYPKRICELLVSHGIKVALIFNNGFLTGDPEIEHQPHNEFWLHFESEADKTAAILLM